MSSTIMGVVTNGVIVPNSPPPEGARVEIQLLPDRRVRPVSRGTFSTFSALGLAKSSTNARKRPLPQNISRTHGGENTFCSVAANRASPYNK